MAHSDYEKSFRKIIKDLSKGIMKIEFYKVNTHDYRLAYGTTNPQLVTDYGFYWQDTGSLLKNLKKTSRKICTMVSSDSTIYSVVDGDHFVTTTLSDLLNILRNSVNFLKILHSHNV